MEHWRQILDYIPFIAAGTQAKTPTVTRLVEAAIIAAGTSFGTYKALEVRMDSFEKFMTVGLQEVKAEVRQMRDDLYQPRSK